jgi:hypothetical protein
MDGRTLRKPLGVHAPEASMLWQKVEPDFLDKIMDMVARCPELQVEVRSPRKRPLIWNAAPNGFANRLSAFP